MKFISWIIVLLLVVTSCGTTQHVNNNRLIQKRKYTKGWLYRGDLNFESSNKLKDNSESIKLINNFHSEEVDCDTIYFKDGSKEMVQVGRIGGANVDTYDCETGKHKVIRKNRIVRIKYSSGKSWYDNPTDTITKTQGFVTIPPASCDTLYFKDGTVQFLRVGSIGTSAMDVFDCETAEIHTLWRYKKKLSKIAYSHGGTWPDEGIRKNEIRDTVYFQNGSKYVGYLESENNDFLYFKPNADQDTKAQKFSKLNIFKVEHGNHSEEYFEEDVARIRNTKAKSAIAPIIFGVLLVLAAIISFILVGWDITFLFFGIGLALIAITLFILGGSLLSKAKRPRPLSGN